MTFLRRAGLIEAKQRHNHACFLIPRPCAMRVLNSLDETCAMEAARCATAAAEPQRVTAP